MLDAMARLTLGQIAFLGSGETSLAGGRIFEMLARRLPSPLRIAVLETPAGFELNSPQVAGRVADFLAKRLQNYAPTVAVIPARKRGTPFSPDEPSILQPLLYADLIFMGPGSPTYAARQLHGSLAWDLVRARHRLGATLVFASAATISVGAWVLPVYEIFKAGEDVHVGKGLNLFSDFGMHLSFIPHWNNAEGGEEVDTSRCFVGMERFETWRRQLPEGSVIVGLDEHSGLILDFEARRCNVVGVSTVSILRGGSAEVFPAGAAFPLAALGEFTPPEPPQRGLQLEAWQMAIHAPPLEEEHPPEEVLRLAEQRQRARLARDWPEADRLREQIAARGWNVQDTKDGYRLTKQ